MQRAPALHSGRITPEARYGYIPGLDGIRAIAVLIVLIAHLGFEHIIPGGFGVTVFFFISGFLITRLLLAETGTTGRIALKDFYIRRFLRLLPALYVMLAVTAVVMIVMGDMPGLWESVGAVTYTTNLVAISKYLTGAEWLAPWDHLWSLAVEEHFYLLFPLLIMATTRKPATALMVCLILCGLALAWRLINIHLLGFPTGYNYVATEARMDSILWGCALSLALHVAPQWTGWRWFIGWAPVIAAGLVLLACFLIRDEAFRQTLRYALQGVSLFLLVLNLFFFRAVGWATRMLEWAPLSWTGRVSYGLYIWHQPVLYFAREYGGLAEGSAAFMMTGVLMSFALTALSYYGVERPLIALRRRFGSHVTAGAKRVEVSGLAASTGGQTK
jgi:peptidoglycan/LPS O-acetylase OafA/YrhL